MQKKFLSLIYMFLCILLCYSEASSKEIYFKGEGVVTPTVKSQEEFDPESVASKAAGNTVIINPFAINFPKIFLYTTVLDSIGNPITGLTINDFFIQEQSTTETSPTVETITSFFESTTEASISFCLVFDVSGSMSGQQLADAKTAAMNFMLKAKTTDRCALVSFSGGGTETIVVPVNWVNTDNDHNGTYDIIDGINSLVAGGVTAVYDGTAKGIDTLSQEPAPKAVIIFTDGATNDDISYDINTLIAKANNEGVPLHTIGLGIDPQNLRDMASGTGGTYHYAPAAQDMAAIYDEISKSMRSQYLISYTTHNPALDGTKRTVNVTYMGTTGTGYYVVNSKPVILLDSATIDLSSQSQPSGADLTISGTVTDLDAQAQGQTLTAELYYKEVSATDYTKVIINLVSQGGGIYSFSSKIPGTAVKIPGMAYYLYVSDGVVQTYSPFNYNTLPYIIPVLSHHSPVITHTIIDSALFNTIIPINAQVTDPDTALGDSVTAVTLYYRIHDTAQAFPYYSANMVTTDGLNYSADIPANQVTDAGVDYFIAAWDTFKLRADHGNSTFPHVIMLKTGSLTVNISPQGAINAGAQWSVDNGFWQNSGGVVSDVTVGTHTVSCKDIPGWIKPVNQTVSIQDSVTTTITVVYTQAAAVIPRIAAGGVHTVALKTDGSVFTWGDNYYGQLGNGSTIKSSIPVQVTSLFNVSGVTAGSYYTASLKNDSVWTWGYNSYGQLGNGSTATSLNPVQATGVSDIYGITAGGAHMVVLKTGGAVWTWGYNNYGQLGNGTNKNNATPAQISGISNVATIASGVYHAVAIKSDGSVWAWGWNNEGQLGNGSTVNSKIPVQIGLSNVSMVSAGVFHTLALKSSGTVLAWGDNSYGELGNGSTIDSLSPIQVTGLSNIYAVAAGYYHSVALKGDGTVWTWGRNSYGQLGNGSTIDSLIPVKVTGLSNIVAIAAGEFHTVALQSDGTVWTWGRNTKGQLGDNSTTDSLIPVKVVGVNGQGYLNLGSSTLQKISMPKSLPWLQLLLF
ncbi:MAG: VWA domain-containing protein [Desulfobacterales bacterium]|nr:VWA domain-containing protein [Desulfobacterales bacterium]